MAELRPNLTLVQLSIYNLEVQTGKLLTPLPVIHIITTPQAGAAEIPLLLAGKTPAAFENFGSGNYSKRPVAVATGGGYDEEGFKLMRGACNSDPNAKIVPWYDL